MKRATQGLIITFFATLLPGAALACSCWPLSPAEHVEGADFIFRGEVIDKRGDAGLLNPLSRGERVVFEVRRIWKGPGLKKMMVYVRSTSSAACGVDFALGWTGAVFAKRGENGEPETNLCLMLQPENPHNPDNYDDLLPGYASSD